MKRRPSSLSRVLIASATIAAIGLVSIPEFAAAAEPGQSQVVLPKGWIDHRFSADDRAALDANVGYAPPAFTSELQWIGGPALTWEALRGKVVFIQTWTSKTSIGRAWAERAVGRLSSQPATDFALVMLHTPDDADKAQAYLAKNPLAATVVVDSTGSFCKQLGVPSQPSNFLIDRNGGVRYAGINVDAIAPAVAQLLAEPADPSVNPPAKPAPKEDATTETPKEQPGDAKGGDAHAGGAPVAFPPANKGRISARDVQGTKAPKIEVAEWLNGAPEMDGKVIIIDFWATWCGPCRAAIPHMSEIAAKFKKDVAVMGISNEGAEVVKEFMAKTKMGYNVGSDPKGRLQNWAAVEGIPHIMVISPDHVVRWQGHPSELNAALVEKIVAASKSVAPAAQ